MSLPAINTGLYDKLKTAAAGWAAEISIGTGNSTRIYHLQVPSGAAETFPYIIFYEASHIFRNWTGGQLHNTVYRVECRSRISSENARLIASAVHDALHGQTLTIAGQTNYRTTAERTTTFVENVAGGQVYRHVTDYRIRLDQSS